MKTGLKKNSCHAYQGRADGPAYQGQSGRRLHGCGDMIRKLVGVAMVMAGLAVPSKAEEQAMATNAATVVVMETSMGNVEIELFADKAPVTVSNFLSYVDSGFYNGTVFHRVIPNFMIQGGGFDDGLNQKPTKAPIKNEAKNGLKNDRGSLSMARTSMVDSATSQFFINVANNEFLNHGARDFGYAVFAKVVAGMDVVDKIAAVKTGNRGPMGDVPVQAVSIKSMKRK